MRIDGACHCGAITYEAEIDPAGVRLCHCTDCQTLSGSAFRVVVSAADGSFTLLSGQPRIYATSAGDGPKKYGLRIGAIRQRAQLRPARQYWCRSALGWAMDLQAVPRFDEQ
jgi:hypothetical protein